MAGWKVWGSPADPILEDATEEDAKKYVEDRPEAEDLYIEDPDGNEYAFEGNRWTEL